MTTRSFKNKTPDASGEVVSEYLFGDVTFVVTSARNGKITIHGMCNDNFHSEQELIACYDETGQGVDLFRVYENGRKVKLRPKPEPKAKSSPATVELGA